MKNITKIIIYNFLILFILIIIFELLFGYFLKPNNFGYMMRSERQKDQIYEVIHNEKNQKNQNYFEWKVEIFRNFTYKIFCIIYTLICTPAKQNYN